MEVDKSTYDSISKLILSMNKISEVECKFKEHLNKDSFTNMLSYCRSIGLQEIINEDQLDIFVQDKQPIRISVTGMNNISTYCKTNKIPDSDIEVIQKIKSKDYPSVILKELGFRVDFRQEESLDENKKNEILKSLHDRLKGFRYKKRYSYQDKYVRYDFTIIKCSKGDKLVSHESFIKSGTIQSPEKYEIEIEYKPMKNIKKDDISEDIEQLIKAMISMYLVYNKELIYISKSLKDEILKNYLNLCFDKKYKIEDVLTTPRNFFAAPQPVTLEMQNILPIDIGNITIRDNYTVTEKADGERMLFYVHSDGSCYTIDSRLHFRALGITLNTVVNCLLDGEFIKNDIIGNTICIFGAFDVYYYNGEDVKHKPLILKKRKGMRNQHNDRISYLHDFEKKFAKKIENTCGIKFFTKEFLWEGDIFTNCKTILSKAKGYPYKIDGLIFTPAKYAVGAVFEGENVSSPYGTWDRVFKYKPSEENTIDFLVKYGSLRAEDGKGLIRELELYVGYNPQQWDRISVMNYINKDFKRPNGYFEKRFKPGDSIDTDVSTAHVVTNNSKILCENGDEIYNNTIVEFAWIDNMWKPMRVRKDKTELYNKQGISRTANDIKTAMSIWKIIKNPITHEMICGDKHIHTYDIDDDIYYFRTIARDKMATKSMLDFHNYWIKQECLIQKHKCDTLFDIACGKAGDLNKWINAGIKKVIGVDYARDNIENPIDGAYARTLKRNPDMKYIYLTLDGSKYFDEHYFNTLTNKDEARLIRIIWGIDKPKENEYSFKKYYRFMPIEGCDVVSCQFALHYFFESKNSLSSFVNNVASNLKIGGLFFGTCLNGQKIIEKMSTLKTNELSGTKDGRIIWNIRKISNNEIEVYMESIGRRIKEYIVNFDILVDEFAKHNIELYQPITSFENEWNIVNQMKDKSSQIVKSILNMSDVEKEYSFMNSYFIFKKTI